MEFYALLLGWVEETRALRVPDWAERLKELLANFARQPLERTHDFPDEFIAKLEQAIVNLADGKSKHEEIDIRLTFEIGDTLLREYNKEFRRVKRHIR